MPTSDMVNFTHIEEDCPTLDIDNGHAKKRSCFIPKVQSHPQPWCGQHLGSGDTVTRNFYNYSNQEGKEKTPMCRMAELSRFHKFKYNYKLLDESGPAHKKLFTVELSISLENPLRFEGSGLSIKKAQQAAAGEALKALHLEEPPDKTPRKRKPDVPQTPVHMLSIVAKRLQLQEPIFKTVLKKPQSLLSKPIPPPTAVFVPCPTDPNAVIPVAFNTTREPVYIAKPYEVSVCLYPGKVIIGQGHNFATARDNAASEALHCLGPMIRALDKKIEQERRQSPSLTITEALKGISLDDPNAVAQIVANTEPEPKHRQKSVISFLHEVALQLKLNVQFEVLLEEGPPHDRNYVVQCALLDANNEVFIQDTGNGRKKKEAQQIACYNIVNTLKTMECAPQIFLTPSLKKLTRRNSVGGKETKRKTIVKDMKMDPSYGHQINPVSRLIQVLQARGEPEPQFTLVGEHGQSRYKEFVMEVTCGDRFCSGNGPNKRLAKRAAAEAMLAEIGFVKPLPSPGKSLLKKKNDPMMNIGVFDLNEMGGEEEQKQENPQAESPGNVTWNLSVDASTPNDSPDSSGQNSPPDGGVPPSPGGKRRVTFNSQVKACPPPEDANYPQPELAPLKADIVVEGKLKRLRKAKEGKRALTPAQTEEVVDSAKIFLNNLTNNMYDGQQYISRIRLEEYSERYKFSVQFTNFPKSPDGNDQNYFALVSLGLEKPLVCHGSGMTADLAADNAAYNAILSLSRLNELSVSPVPQ